MASVTPRYTLTDTLVIAVVCVILAPWMPVEPLAVLYFCTGLGFGFTAIHKAVSHTA